MKETHFLGMCSIDSIATNPEAIGKLLDANLLDVAADDQALFIKCCEAGYDKLVARLLTHPDVDPTTQDLAGICRAATKGHVGIVTQLLADSRVDPRWDNNAPLRSAVGAAQPAVVDLLLKVSRIQPLVMTDLVMTDPFRDWNGDWNADEKVPQQYVLRTLLKDGRYDPTYDKQITFNDFCENGRDDLVKLFLADERINPNLASSEALRKAMYYNKPMTVALLLADNRADPTYPDRLNEVFRDVLNMTSGAIETLKVLLADERVRQCDAFESLVARANASGNYALTKLFKKCTKKAKDTDTTPSSRDINVNVNVHVYVHNDTS